MTWGGQLARLDRRGLLLATIDDSLARTNRAETVSIAVANNGDASLLFAQRFTPQACEVIFSFGIHLGRCTPAFYSLDARLDRQGVRTTTGIAENAAAPRTLAVGGGGNGFLLAYSDAISIATVAMSANGALSTPQRLVLSSSNPAVLGIAGNSERYLVVWRDSALSVTAVNADGSLGETVRLGDERPAEAAVLALADGRFAIAWPRAGSLVVRETVSGRRRP